MKTIAMLLIAATLAACGVVQPMSTEERIARRAERGAKEWDSVCHGGAVKAHCNSKNPGAMTPEQQQALQDDIAAATKL